MDAAGYQAQPRDLAFGGVHGAAIRAMQQHETSLGFASRAQWPHCLAALHAALAQDGRRDADVRMRGSATTFFSANPDKRFPQSPDEYCAQAEEARARWEHSPFASAVMLPNRYCFDSRYRLGPDVGPSDVAFQLASGMLARRLEARFPGARDGGGKVVMSALGGHHKDAYVRQVCPALDVWTTTWLNGAQVAV